MNKFKVFISHSTKDKDFYPILYKKLLQDVPKNIQLILPHEDDAYQDTLALIECSDCFVLFSHSLKGAVGCGIELGYALALGKPSIFVKDEQAEEPLPKSVLEQQSKMLTIPYTTQGNVGITSLDDAIGVLYANISILVEQHKS